nr:MAG TPA: hypothetical protein [Caudoviricetes sp.]
MQIHKNIRFDRFLANQIDQNKLNCIDCFQLSAAEQLCKEFPGLPVVLVPQQQSMPIMQSPPAIFVQVFRIQRAKRLDGFMEWTLAANFAYISKDANATSEQQDAAIKIMDMAESIPPLEGMQYPYTMYVTDSRTVDGIVNITGTVTVWERRPDDAPLIQEAETIVNIKEEEEHKNGCNEANSSRSVFTDHRR